jgi:hypothetical protein
MQTLLFGPFDFVLELPSLQTSPRVQPNKDQVIHGTESQSLRLLPSLDVKLIPKDQDLSFQRDPRPDQ